MPDKVYRTAIYCRLSREDGDKVESNSIVIHKRLTDKLQILMSCDIVLADGSLAGDLLPSVP